MYAPSAHCFQVHSPKPSSTRVLDPDITNQVIVKRSQPKHEAVKEFMTQLVDSKVNLLGSDGLEWSYWRKIFNPGFSNSHLTTLVSDVVEYSIIFCDILNEHAIADDVFRLEEAATRLTIDIIAKTVL